MLDITKESLTELGMRLPFHAAQTSNGFYLARATWAMEHSPEYVPHWTEDTLLGGERCSMLASRQVQATLFFRSAFQWKGYHRQMASCLMLYKSIPHEGWLYLGYTLNDVLAQLPEHGYTGTERWLPDPYAHFRHHGAPMDQEAMWNANEFAVVRQRSSARKARPSLDDLDEQPL